MRTAACFRRPFLPVRRFLLARRWCSGEESMDQDRAPIVPSTSPCLTTKLPSLVRLSRNYPNHFNVLAIQWNPCLPARLLANQPQLALQPLLWGLTLVSVGVLILTLCPLQLTIATYSQSPHLAQIGQAAQIFLSGPPR
jgi:hypothetical protein